MIDNAKVIEALGRLRRSDQELGKELEERLDRGMPEVAVVPERLARPGQQPTLETIVLRTGRPVLAVSQDEAQLTFTDAESEVWRDRLVRARGVLTGAIRAVGRIELDGHPYLDWVGTGWLVRPDVIATNRHVAREFGRSNSTGFVFRTGASGRLMEASIDFLEEVDRSEQRSFLLREILHIEDDDGPDLAFLRVEGTNLTSPIALSENVASADQQVAVIGYPARDSRIPDQDLMERIFGDVYDKKRLAPGQVKGASPAALLHDCSTLGGNSGSVVLDLATGSALGIHFAGRFLEANYAVPADIIEERLRMAERGETRRAITHGRADGPRGQAQTANPVSFSCTIPIQVTIEVGGPVREPGPAGSASTVPVSVKGDAGGTAIPSAGSHQAPDDDEGDEVFATEGVPEDYLDRGGYRADFLGGGIKVALPKVTRDSNQVLTFDFAGNPDEVELKYEHFSVVMNGKRRMCFYSAVNIDGNRSRKVKRSGWLRDPRIAVDMQIMKDCYGNAPKFSRGHMTRREDPIWGTQATASRGNKDSMHVTNAVPQMQIFNAGIWLGLEDYALDHAREDDMKICVFTGPVFRSNDPLRFGIKIPRLFWKVIAFVHDETEKLSATGYSISQDKFLQPEEFVFGTYETHQRSLKWIEQRAGLSFGPLTALDLFEDSDEAAPAPLRDFRQIRFF
ncbi:MAG: DNA/RNA non-specific endonuclease [Acidobacteriota bacterium]